MRFFLFIFKWKRKRRLIVVTASFFMHYSQTPPRYVTTRVSLARQLRDSNVETSIIAAAAGCRRVLTEHSRRRDQPSWAAHTDALAFAPSLPVTLLLRQPVHLSAGER